MSSTGDWNAEGCYRVDPKYAAPKVCRIKSILGVIYGDLFAEINHGTHHHFSHRTAAKPQNANRHIRP